jgi:serine/threonine protein kinase
MGLTSGTKLGPYEIASPLGAGGMGEVYRARDKRLDRAVAIKVLPANLSAETSNPDVVSLSVGLAPICKPRPHASRRASEAPVSTGQPTVLG